MTHEDFMHEALTLSKAGWPAASPNPMVGCVIVKDQKIVSSGYHERFGGPHAEVNAINQLDPSVSPSDCTLYVTLEPCSHQGKTPPCADLLIGKGFKKIVIGAKDPNPLVAGKGIERLKAAGAEVLTGILESEIRALNKRFFCYFENKRPYIILKWAISADGFVSRDPLPKNKEDNFITRQEARKFVHQLRSEVTAIMVGKNTVKADDPQLTTRLVPGRNPVRIIIDRNMEVSPEANVLNEAAGTIVFNNAIEEERGHLLYLKIDFDKNIIGQICEKLYQMQIQTLLVEGGTKLLNSLIKEECWDEAIVLQNPDLYFKNGLKGPEFPIKNTFDLIGEDKVFHHFRNETLPAKGPLSKEIF